MTTNVLVYVKNFEEDVYYVNRKRILNLHSVKINDKIYNVESEIKYIEYTEHGNIEYDTSIHFFVEEEVFGIKMRFDLNQIVQKTEVIAMYYTLK